MIEFFEGIQRGKFLCSKYMIPQQLTSMEEGIFTPLEHDFLLNGGIRLLDETWLKVFEFVDPSSDLHAVLLPLVSDPLLETGEQCRAGI